MKVQTRFGLVVAVAIIAFLPSRAEAVAYTFTQCITPNNPECAAVASQLRVDVTDAGGGLVDFTFTNPGTVASSVTALYFDASGFLESPISVMSQSSGVSFTPGVGSPGQLPGTGSDVSAFSSTSGILADGSVGAVTGIGGADEYLTLRIAMVPGRTFAEIIAAMGLGSSTDAGIRIGAHVQQIGALAGSDSILCCGLTQVTPEPATVALFGLAALGIAYRMRRRQQ